jgi:hypothetical protein
LIGMQSRDDREKNARCFHHEEFDRISQLGIHRTGMGRIRLVALKSVSSRPFCSAHSNDASFKDYPHAFDLSSSHA